MNKLNHRDVLIRALKTAAQSFVAVFVVAFGNLFDVYQHGGLSGLKSALVALLSAALAAAVSATWNYYLQYRDQ